jgi:F0F1-type ATP synthase epsilon subunit
VNLSRCPDSGKCKFFPATPLISELQTGVLTYSQGGTNFQFHVSGGFVEAATIMCRSASRERADEMGARARGDANAPKSSCSWSEQKKISNSRAS